jgi:hypothetical protein
MLANLTTNKHTNFPVTVAKLPANRITQVMAANRKPHSKPLLVAERRPGRLSLHSNVKTAHKQTRQTAMLLESGHIAANTKTVHPPLPYTK